MDRILNQFRRVYTDDGRHDVDFSERERLLQEAKARLVRSTQELSRASENLNRAAIEATGGGSPFRRSLPH